MLNKIKLLLGINGDEQNETIQLLIELVTDEAKAYCNVDTITGLESIIMQMVVFKYNLLGHEGLTSEAYGGVSYSYSANYPESILSALNAHRRLKVM